MAAEGATQVTPESLGQYLTALVAEKNARYPKDDAWLLACGMLAVVVALKKTCPYEVDLREELQAIGRFLQLQWPMA